MRTRVPNEQNTAPPRASLPPASARHKASASAIKNELSEDVMEFILSSSAGTSAGASLSGGQRSLGGTTRPTMILTANPNADTTIPFDTYMPVSEAMSLTSPTLEDILGIEDSADGPLILSPSAKRGRRPPPSVMDDEVLSEASDAKRPRDQRSEIDEDDERVRQRKAQSARSSRLKHKEYVKSIERENERIRSSHAELEELNQAYKTRVRELETQVDYLRRVIANDSAIARLVAALPDVEGVQLSSSMTLPPPPPPSAAAATAASNVETQFVPGGGVCLHLIDKNRVSLELCADCARKARGLQSGRNAAMAPSGAENVQDRDALAFAAAAAVE